MSVPMQLPEAGDSHLQERNALIRFATILDLKRFLVRQETETDYGTDRVVELIVNGNNVSNYRFHVQGKSAKQLAPNMDGTHSYPIPVKTLNYLNNQAGSIVVLFIENQNIMKWAWVHSIFRVAHEREIDLTSTCQATFSVRFDRELDDAAQSEIYTFVLEQGQLGRRLNEIISRASPTAPVQALVDLRSKVAVDTTEVCQQLKQHGFALVAAGQLYIIEELIALLPGSVRDDVEIAFVVSYAKLASGAVHEAMSWLPRGDRAKKAGKRFQQLGHMIGAAVEHALSLKSRTEYEAALSKARAIDPTSLLSLQLAFAEAWSQMVRAQRREVKAAMSALSEAATHIRAHPDVDAYSILMIDIAEWQQSGMESGLEWLEGTTDLQMRSSMSLPVVKANVDQVFGALTSRRKAWSDAAGVLSQRARTIGSSLLAAEVVLGQAMVVMTQVMMAQSLFVAQGGELSFPVEALTALASQLKRTVSELEELRCYETAARGYLFLADIWKCVGDAAAGATSAARAAQLAEELGAINLRQMAQQTLAESLPGAALLDEIRRSKHVHPALLGKPHTPQDLDDFAESIVRAARIPAAHARRVRDHVEAGHRVEIEQRNWCGWFELRDTVQPESLYTTTPTYMGACKPLGLVSKLVSTNWEAVIASFKSAHCVGCPQRKPLSRD